MLAPSSSRLILVQGVDIFVSFFVRQVMNSLTYFISKFFPHGAIPTREFPFACVVRGFQHFAFSLSYCYETLVKAIL